MSAKTNNIRIGLFVLVAVALFIAGLLAFGAKGFFVKKLTYETAIEGDVSGLAVGSKVLLRGVPIGNVSKIDFAINVYPGSTSRVIIVESEIDRPVFTKDPTSEGRERRREAEVAGGLRAMVKSQGITGSSIIELQRLDPMKYPPPQLDYTPRHPYIPSAPGQFTRMLESMERSLHSLQKLDFEGLSLGVSNTLAQTSSLIDKLNRLDLQSTVGKADTLLDQFKETVAGIDTTIKSMKLDTLGHDAGDLVVGLKESNAKLQTALGQAGTALDRVGTLPLGEALEDLRSTAQTLDDVLLELRRYPSGFIFGKPPPPAKSVQPAAR